MVYVQCFRRIGMIGLGWQSEAAPLVTLKYRRSSPLFTVSAAAAELEGELGRPLKKISQWHGRVGTLTNRATGERMDLILGEDRVMPSLYLFGPGQEALVEAQAAKDKKDPATGHLIRAEFRSSGDFRFLTTGPVMLSDVSTILHPWRSGYGFADPGVFSDIGLVTAVMLYELLFHPLTDASGCSG